MLDRAEIERFIRAAGYEAKTPVAVGVSLPSGSPVLVAWGERPDAPQFDTETIAYAGSLAKQMTGACAALLARDGALDLDAPIANWLPGLPAWSKRIRVRHLIHHTAGLPDTDTVWAEMERAGEAHCDALCISRALHTPGSLDDGTPLDYAWGVRTFRAAGLVVHSHGGTWEGQAAKLVRLPTRRASFAVIACDSSVIRMAALSSALQDALVGSTSPTP